MLQNDTTVLSEIRIAARIKALYKTYLLSSSILELGCNENHIFSVKETDKCHKSI